MRLPEAPVRDTYEAVITDLSTSDVAQSRGLHIEAKHSHLQELAAIHGVLPLDGCLLDVGTGLGVVPETMLRMGHRVICVDAPRNQELRWSLNRPIALGAEGHFVAVGRESIPIPDGAVDVVFAGDVIEHLPGTPRHFLAELARVLKPGGHIILTTPNAVRLPVRIRVTLGYSNWPPVALYLDDPPEPPFHTSHHHEYTGSEMGDVLRDTGFRDIRISFFEDTLRAPNILKGWGDIPTQNRFRAYWSKGGRLNPFGLVRLALLGITRVVPGLRSTLLAVAQK